MLLSNGNKMTLKVDILGWIFLFFVRMDLFLHLNMTAVCFATKKRWPPIQGTSIQALNANYGHKLDEKFDGLFGYFFPFSKKIN